MLKEWLKAAMRSAGVSQSELARRLARETGKNILPTTVNKMITGERRISVDEIVAIAKMLSVPLPLDNATTRQVPLVGYVRAGASAVLYDAGQGPFEFVDAPPDSSPSMVAVQVTGDSMYPLAKDGWLLYYDRLSDGDLTAAIGELSVVGLISGEILVKTVEVGSQPGRYNLISLNAAPIRDVEIAWAAPVVWIKPNRNR